MLQIQKNYLSICLQVSASHSRERKPSKVWLNVATPAKYCETLPGSGFALEVRGVGDAGGRPAPRDGLPGAGAAALRPHRRAARRRGSKMHFSKMHFHKCAGNFSFQSKDGTKKKMVHKKDACQS